MDGEKKVRIFGEMIPVKCHVAQVDGLSAHADRKELFRWLDGFGRSLKMTFVVHGEWETARNFANDIHVKYGWNTAVPDYLESAELFKGI